jgi:hypothetical protein
MSASSPLNTNFTPTRATRRERTSALDGMIALALLAAVSGYPMIASLPIALSLDTRLVTLPYRGFVVLLSLGILALAGLSRRRATAPVRVRLCLAMACVVLGLRFVNDVFVLGTSTQHNQSAAEFALFFGGVTLLPAVALFIPMRVSLERKVFFALLAFGVATVACATLAMAASSDAVNLALRADREGLNAISYATTGAVLLLLLRALPKQSRSTVRAWLLIACGVALALVPLFTAASRGPVLSMLVALSIGHITASRRRWRALVTVLAVATAMAMATSDLIDLVEDSSDSVAIARRLSDIREDQSTEERLIILSSSWNVFVNNPLLGGAIVEPILKSYPHNILLEALMVGGIPFGLLILLLVASTAVKAVQLQTNSAEQPFRRFTGMFVIFTLSMCMLSGSLYSSPEFWAVVAFSFSLRTLRPHNSGQS